MLSHARLQAASSTTSLEMEALAEPTLILTRWLIEAFLKHAPSRAASGEELPKGSRHRANCGQKEWTGTGMRSDSQGVVPW